MKYVLLLPLFIFFNNLDAQTLWTNTYKLTESSTLSPKDIVIQNEKIIVGGYYFAGSSSASRTVFVLSVDLLNGDSITIDNCDAGVFCDFREDILEMGQNENNDIFTAGSQSFGPADYVAKINSSDDMTVNWIRSDLVLDSIHHIDQLETVSDGVIIAGSFSDLDYYVMKLNFDGEKIWLKRLPMATPGYAAKMDVLPNENIVLLYKNGLNTVDVILSLIDPFGNLIYTKEIDRSISRLGVTNNNEIITFQSISVFNAPCCIVKYTMNGDELILNDDYEFSTPSRILTNEEGEIFVIETDRVDEVDGFTIRKLSSNGVLLWNEFYGEEGYEYRYVESELISDESIVVLGRKSLLTSPYSREVLLISVDVSNLPTSDNRVIDESRFFIYPNPSRDIIRIKANNFITEHLASYELYTINGRLVQKDYFIATETIRLHHLSEGIYTIKLLNEKGETIGVARLNRR